MNKDEAVRLLAQMIVDHDRLVEFLSNEAARLLEEDEGLIDRALPFSLAAEACRSGNFRHAFRCLR